MDASNYLLTCIKEEPADVVDSVEMEAEDIKPDLASLIASEPNAHNVDGMMLESEITATGEQHYGTPMPTAPKKVQQSAAAGAATDAAANASGTPGSTYFRRKKIVPAVVAKKISNNNIKNSAKIASPKESSKNVPAREAASAVVKEATETEQQTAQPKEAAADIPLPRSSLKAEESKDVKMPDKQKSHATAKPAAAFRRIKPKVVIPQTQKPAKSILKNSMTPVKGSSSTQGDNYAQRLNETTPRKDPELAVHSDEGRTAEDLPIENPISEESVKLSHHPDPEPMQARREKDLDSILGKTNVAVDTSTSEDVAKGEEENKYLDVQNSIDLEKNQSNSSITITITPLSIPAAEDTATQSDLEKKESNSPITTTITPVSIPVSEDTAKQPNPDALAKPKSTNEGTTTKTIKRAISLSKLSPEIANLLKSSLGKKATKGTKPPQANAKPMVVTKQPEHDQQIATVRLLPEASQANQENESTQLNVAESDKPSTVSSVSTSAAGNRLPVLEDRIDNISSSVSIITKPPSDVKSNPTATKLPVGGQVGGIKKIQKVHQLTAEQQRLVLNSLKRCKAKRSVKMPEAAPVAKDTNVAASQGTLECTPIAPVYSVPKDDHRVNIISQIILPRLTVASLGETAQQNVPTKSAVTDPSNNSNQYPKLFICHKPASAATSTDPVETRSQLVPPSVSVTVLPKTTHTIPGYPRPFYLPMPVVTVRPTAPKQTPYANTSPPALPTPIISVTVSPMNSSNSMASPISVPVNPRIVPRIVIDGCDTVDHDSQSSLTSTSSSSSTGQNTCASKKQSKDRPDTGTAGCSPGTLDKLRAKSLKNLRMKNGGLDPSGVVDTQAYENVIRQYCRPSIWQRSNLKSLEGNNETQPSISAFQRVKECISKRMMKPNNSTTIETSTSILIPYCTTEQQAQLEASTVSGFVSEPVKSCELANVPEVNEFLGFSTLSIENAERDFENRSRTIDLVLESQRKSLKDASDSQVAIAAIETSASTEASKPVSKPPLAEVIEESVIKTDAPVYPTLSTTSNHQNRTDSTDPCPSLKRRDTERSSEIKTQIKEPQTAPLQDENAAAMKVPINLYAPSETALKETTVIILDSDEEVETEHEKHIEIVENENATSRIDTNDVPQESVADASPSDEDFEDVLDVAACGCVSEPENTLAPNVEPMAEEEDPEIPVPDLIDKAATGVDVIMAMAKLRRENRVLSLDDTSDREQMSWMDPPTVAPNHATPPSTSGEQLGSKKKRKRRRKKRRDQFVQLLLKHVNYDSLIEDLVRQEKRHYNYISSSDEEERIVSPFQRYIREQKEEQERSAAIVQSDNNVSSPTITSDDDESLAEETILNRILSKRRCAAAVTASSCTKKPAECSNTPHKLIGSGDDRAMSHGVSDDQREDVQRTIICDKAAERDAAEVNEAPALKALSDVEMVTIDSLPQANNAISCDISETNAATCEKRSDALVAKEAIETNSSPPKVLETINTHAKQEQLQSRTRKRVLRRVGSRKRPARRVANKKISSTIKRPKYITTPTVEMPLYDSSDASKHDEVVSDCSSGGLSIGEMVANRTRKSLPARQPSTDNRNVSVEGTVNVGDGSAEDESNKNFEGKVLPDVTVARETSTRSGRSRKSGRRHSSSSNSISSNSRNHSLSCDGDLSSSDDTKPGKRRKLRRKRRSLRYGTRANRAPEQCTVATVDCDTNRLISTTTTSTTNISSHLPTASKPSNLDAQYVITEVAGESGTEPPRVLDVINVRNNRVLSSGMPSTRANRNSNMQPEPHPTQVPGKDAQKKSRNRSAKSNQATNADSEKFISPKSTTDWRQQEQLLTTNEKDPAGQSQPDNAGEPVSSEPVDASDLENQLVKCGNCGKEMLQSGWQEHSNIHNGATFRVGIDFPLDMKDVKAVSTAIGRFMKLQRRAEVACERCGTVKKSGLGMASHMNQCGLSYEELEQSKTTCTHCGRKMKAISLMAHLQQHCRVLKEQQRQIALTTPREDTAVTKETTASGRKKRKSVASAEKKIKKIAKETNDEFNGKLVLEIYGRGVSNAIMQCWLSHLNQLSDAVCAYIGCPFFGMTSEHMRTEFNDDGTDPKPLYQCAKCEYMSTAQKPIYDHLAVIHPQTFRRAAEQRRKTSNGASDGDSDVFMASGGSTSADDTYSSSALDEEDEGGTGSGKSKKGKGKKQTGGSNKSKSKKSSDSPKGNSKKNAGNKGISSEVLDATMASGGTEETEVYKEMVLQESIEYKQGKGNYHVMTENWTQEFRREHYAARLLFSELRPDLDTSYLRSINNVRDYLPKATRSIRYVQCNSKQYDPGYEPETFANRWQQKSTFDGEALGCESIFYCGGPVVSLDWLPLPDDCENDCDQYLAVACKQSFDEYYNGEQLAVPRSHKCLVQIWNVGPVQNLGSTKVTLHCPRLAFAIACDYGPIWQIAFCPSGCYNDPAQGDDLERLGVLAVAGSDGDVHLYALSRSMVVTENETSTTPRILHLRPVLLLSLSTTVGPHNHPASDFTGRSVVQITWTREKGHNVLAAGYSNGVVAVWNLAATSPLLCGKKNGIRTLLPVHKILHSSSGSITALDLHYSSGSRYLVVCNADRRMKVYDLRSSLYQPQETLSMIMRSRVSSIRWLLHFPVLVIAYDDSLYIDRCAYSTHQPRDIGLRMFSIFTVGSEMTDLGTNDWYSMNAVATSGGDLVCHRPVPFVYGMNYKKLAQILTTTIPMKLNAIDDSADVSRYKAFSEEYGILFSDTDKVPTAMDTAALHLKTWRRAKFSHYPAIRLNQIRWNPNSFSYTYYAIGYQAGFVRVRVLRS